MAELVDQLNTALAGRYRVTGLAGVGGMAAVYRARDLRHDRDVALKVLRQTVTASLDLARFHAEIATTARLQHPHLLPLFDSGEAAGCLYYVMPFVEGPTLRTRLDRERHLPIDDATSIACAVSTGLHYAHRHGVVHRDVKPENILLCDGVPVLADFGIALGTADASAATRLTHTGAAIGTVAYMSPEQAAGVEPPDLRSDVYSLACVLYEALAGELPHPGPTVYAVMMRRLSQPPSAIRVTRPAVPMHVEEALLRALAVAPDDRFPSAEAFAAALRPPRRASARDAVLLHAEPRSYGALMHDEAADGSLADARERVRDVVESAVLAAGATLHPAPGAAVVATFDDARSGRQGAHAARDAVARHNDGVPPAERVHYRFGLADGHGADAPASDLASSAATDGIAISDPLRQTLRPAGEAPVVPSMQPRDAPPPQLEALDIPPPAQPSIALMPFLCLEGDAEGEALAEGLRIDITNALMKMGRIFLVAPSSMNRFRGAPGVETARRVGTRHVLEGTIRRSGPRVRVSMQLTDAGTDALVWSEQYERQLDDGFALEDEVTARVITELDVTLSMGEQARLWRKCLTHPSAREHYYRGLGYFFQSTCDSVALARAEFERVARLVPDSPVGPTWTALTLWIQATHDWDAEAPALALAWARRAAEMPDADGQAHTVLGATLLLEGRWDDALRAARDSVRIRPGCNTANGILGSVLLHCGDAEGAIRHVKRAIRIGPIYPPWFLEILSAAHRETCQLELAITVGREILRLAPDSVSGRLVLASALVRAGWSDEARHVAAAVPHLEPGFDVDAYVSRQPFRSSALKARLGEDLRQAIPRT